MTNLRNKILVSTLLLGYSIGVGGCSVQTDEIHPLVVNAHGINAWSTDRDLLITSELATLIDTRSELAFVVAHELGHMVLMHHLVPEVEAGAWMEWDADEFAFKAIQIAGHDVCSGVRALRKIYTTKQSDQLQARLLHWSIIWGPCK